MYGIFEEIFFFNTKNIQKIYRNILNAKDVRNMYSISVSQIFLKFLINFCSEVVKSGQF